MCETVTGAFRHIEEISSFKKAVNNQEPWTREPDTLGMAIRRWDVAGGYWKLHVLLAILVEAMRSAESDGDLKDIPEPYVAITDIFGAGYEIMLSAWQQFLDHLQELEILDAPSWKGLVDGGQLAMALGVEPGKWVMAALQVCMAWRFRNPRETNPAGAIEEVRSRSKELRIPFEGTAGGAEKRSNGSGNLAL
jgi:hypothetical protein